MVPIAFAPSSRDLILIRPAECARRIFISRSPRGDYRLVTQMYFPGEALNEKDLLISTMQGRARNPALAICRAVESAESRNLGVSMGYRFTAGLTRPTSRNGETCLSTLGVKCEFHQDQCTTERNFRNPDLALVRTDNFRDDRKAKPGARPADTSPTPEALENVLALGLRNARPAVGNTDRSGRRYSHGDFGSRPCMEDGILDQIAQSVLKRVSGLRWNRVPSR